MESFIREFKTTNELLFKERNNSLSKLEFEVYGLSRAINKAQIIRCEAKGVTTRVLLNKLPSKEKDPGSFTIPCDIGNLHIDNALADLGASIRLMPYIMYEKLGFGETKPTRMSLKLADRSIQYLRGIAENVLIKIEKFILPIDFVILDMREDSRIPIILGRPFLATARAMIDVFNKKITLRVGDDEELLEDNQMDSFLVSNLEKCIVQSNPKSDDSEEPIRRITQEDKTYPKTQEMQGSERAQNEHLYSASANGIDEKKPELKELPPHLECTYLKRDESCLDYVSKWVKAQALLTNDARVVVKFLKGLFARFRVPKALISNRGTYFGNSQLEKALLKYERTHTLIWRNKIDLEEQSLDDLFNSHKIYEAEVKSSSSASTSTQKIAFVSSQTTDSTNEQVSDVASVSVASVKNPVSALPKVDTLSNAIIYSFFASQSNSSQLDNDGLKQIDADDLEEMDLKWQMAMWSATTAIGNDTLQESVAMTGAFRQKKNQRTMPSWHSPLQVLPVLTMRYHSGDGYHVVPPPYTGAFMPPKPDLVFHDAPNVNETDHTAFNIKLSPTKPNKVFSHTHRPSTPIIEDWVSDSEDDAEVEIPQNIPSFVQPTKQVKTPRPSVKTIETSIPAAKHKIIIPKPKSHGISRNRKACFHMVPTAVLTKSKLAPLTAARQVTTAVTPTNVTRPRPAKTIVTKHHSPPKRNINRSPSSKAITFPPKVTAAKAPIVNAVKGVQGKWEWKPKCPILDHVSRNTKLNGGYVAFGGNPKGGKISGKGKIRTGKLDFDDVYFVKELKFNLFSVSQMYDKKNNVLFTDTKCIVLSLEFKLPDENQVLLTVPRENNMYNVDLKNIIPSRDLTYLFAKATLDESNLWHRRLSYINFKTMNKLVKGNLVRGLPTKVFENNHVCVACKKVKQHRASCKTKPVSSVSQPLQRLHIDLFGPTFVKSLNKKSYCLVVTDDYSRFTWVFFLATKDETSLILKTFITGEDSVQQYVLFPLWSSSSINPQNTDDDAAFGGKKPEFEGRKPEFEVHVSPRSNAQTKKQDDKTKREAKGKNPVESST
nr:putative ribonuclease H-like domain-containing protein [Tanacetum cinerariifolium]